MTVEDDRNIYAVPSSMTGKKVLGVSRSRLTGMLVGTVLASILTVALLKLTPLGEMVNSVFDSIRNEPSLEESVRELHEDTKGQNKSGRAGWWTIIQSCTIEDWQAVLSGDQSQLLESANGQVESLSYEPCTGRRVSYQCCSPSLHRYSPLSTQRTLLESQCIKLAHSQLRKEYE